MAVFWPDTPVPGTVRDSPHPLPAERARARPPLLLRTLEATLTLAVLLLMSTALVGPLADPKQTGLGPAWLRLMWLPCYAVVLCLMALPSARIQTVWRGAVLSLALVLLAFISLQWSIAPDVTTRRVIALLFTTVTGLYLAARFDWREMIELVALTFLILAVGSLLAVVLVPSLGIQQDTHPGAWRGLWYEKNMFGGTMVRGALACACAALINPARRWLWWPAAAFCALLVVPSTSTTALVGVAVTVMGLVGLGLLRRGPAAGIVAVWLLAVAAFAALLILQLDPDLFFKAVGKDPSLTGRTDIWDAVMRQIDQRPWLGYGFSAFWNDERSTAAAWVRHEVEWKVSAADNGWLEIMTGLGWTGALLFGVVLAIGSAAALLSIRRGPHAYWAVIFLALLVLFSISESIIMKPNELEWVLFVATLAKLLQSQNGQAPGPAPVNGRRGRPAPSLRPPAGSPARRV